MGDYLLTPGKNELIRVLDKVGFVATDLRGAMREIDEIGQGTGCGKYLYHAILSPAHGERLTEDQAIYCANRLLENLGLKEHQAAIVEHVKGGEAHYHIVANRIDIETMKAVRMSHNYRAHELTARELEKEFGLQHVKGVHILENDEIRAKYGPDHDDIKQAEKSKYNPYKWREELKALAAGKSGQELIDVLAARGHIVAHGDKVDFIILDPAGNAKRLAQQLNVKVADLRIMFGSVDPQRLPNENEAREIQLEYKDKKLAEKFEKREKKEARLGATLYDSGGLVRQQHDANRHIEDHSKLKTQAEKEAVRQDQQRKDMEARKAQENEKAARAAPILAHEEMQKEVAQQEQERRKREEPAKLFLKNRAKARARIKRNRGQTNDRPEQSRPRRSSVRTQ